MAWMQDCSSIDASTLVVTLPLFMVLIWTLVSSSVKITRSRAILYLHIACMELNA